MPRRVSNSEIVTQTHHQHLQRRQAAVHQHLVDDHLEEQRRDQREECRKNEAMSTSLRRRRYLLIAPRNQAMPNRRATSDKPARRVIRISPPSQTDRSSARAIKAGRAPGGRTRTLSPLALASSRNPPSRKRAIAGKGVLASRDHPVRQARALSPRSLAHRRISGAPSRRFPAGAGSVRDPRRHPGNAATSQGPRAPDRPGSRYRLQCSLALSGARGVQACGWAKTGRWFDTGSAIGSQPGRRRPWRRLTP